MQHTSLSIGQGFGPIRLEYIPYLTQFLLCPLLTKGAEGVPDAIAMLDEYGLDKDDLMETLRAMQFTIENDRVFKGCVHPDLHLHLHLITFLTLHDLTRSA